MSHPNQIILYAKSCETMRTGGKGMIRMVQIEYIKKLYYKEGKSQREIAKMLGHSRNTISKYLEKDVFTEPKYNLTVEKASPVLGPFKPIIDKWLEEDEQMPKKQRHTGARIYQRLVEEYGFTGGCSTVRNYVYEKRATPPKVFIPLEYELGNNAQCDWGQALAIIGGQKVTVHLFCMTLSASGASFVMAFPNERQEAFLEGHKQAFEFFGGIPNSVTYDNLKSAVKKVLTGHDRIEQDVFIALRTHYLFDSIYCNIAKGNEKGKVEGFVGYARRNFFVPLPEHSSFQELNDHLKAKCLGYINQAKRKGNRTVKDLFELEKEKLQPLPLRPFPCYRYIDTKVNSYSQVQFENNRYSVPVKYAYQRVQLHAYVDHIEIYCQNNLVAKHNRSYDKGQEVSNFDHYLDVLTTKPRAIANAKPINDANLPPFYYELRQKIMQREELGNQEFISILKLHKEYPSNLVDEAIQLALAYEVYHYEGIKNLVLQLVTPQPKVKPLRLETHPELSKVIVAKPQLTQFDKLLERGC